MNAPIILAQLSGSQPAGSSPPRNLKIEKPQTNQAVTIRLDGNTRLDFSDIASEKLTFVRVGEKLIVLFDNQSTVTIDPMFNSSGEPLPNVSFEVGPDRIVDGTAFANLFPITTDQSVLPAAGAAGGPSAGANFSNPNAGSLGGSGARLALLGNEEGGGEAGGDGDGVAIPAPIINPIPQTGLDDEGLSEGNIGGPGDTPGAATTITQSLNTNFGTARAGAFFLFQADQPSLEGLFSGGLAISFVIQNNTALGTPTIVGFVNGDPSNPANIVFTITLDNAPLNGAYTITLFKPLDHPIANTEDSIIFTISFSATSEGGTANGAFTVDINDDSPELALGQQQATTVDEDGLQGVSHFVPFGDNIIDGTPAEPNGNPGGISGDAAGEAVTATGTLGIRWGADNTDTADVDGVQDGATAGALTGRALFFTSATVLVNGVATALTSHGEAVTYALSNANTTLTASAGGRVVFTVTLSDDGSGSYVFTLHDELDHPIANTEDDLALQFNFTARDFDQDTVAGNFTVTVDDDTPVFVDVVPKNGLVYEDGFFGGNAGDTYHPGQGPIPGSVISLEDTGTFGLLGIRWGADNFDTPDTRLGGFVLVSQDGAVEGSTDNTELTGRAVYFTNTTVGTDLPAGGGESEPLPGVLTSRGEVVQFRLDLSGSMLIGFVPVENQETGERIVFTIKLFDDGEGRYVFELLDVLDHPAANAEDDINLTFNITARDFDGDTAASAITITVNDDAPIQTNAPAEKVAINEDDLADFNPFYIEGVPVFGLLQGSLGSSPFDGGTGVLGTVPVSGSLSEFVSPGADGPGSFHLVSETQAETLLQTIGPNGGVLTSHGDVVNDARFVNIDGVGEILGFFASDGRLVAGLFVSDTGNYNFRLFDQIDHPVGDNPATPAWESVKDIVNLDLSRFVQYTDFDGDTITLKPNTFSVDVKDDAPIAIGAETGLVNENDLADFNPLYPVAFDFLQGSLGTSPFDGFTDGSVTGLFGTVPVYGFLTDNIVGGADEFGKFDIVPENIAEQLLANLGGPGTYLKSHGDIINDARTIDIPGLGEAMGFFASDGRLVFGLFVGENGFYNFRLFDQLDHPVSDTDPANGEPNAIKDTILIDLSKFVTFTDFDGDTIDLGANRFVMSVVDDIPVLTGQTIRVTLDESDLNNFVPGWDLIPSDIKALFPVEGSAGTSPGADTSALLFNTTGKSGLLNEVIGTNVVNGGADEFGKFALVSDARAELLIPTEFAGLKSKGEAVSRVEILDLGVLGEVMGFFAGDRLVFTLTVNEVGFYDIRLWDQIDHIGNDGGQIDIDLSKFVTYTDFDGDAIDLGNDTLVLRVIDDAPVASGLKVTGLVEEEQFAILSGGDLTHGNEDRTSLGGDDQDAATNLDLATSNVTAGSIAPIVKVGADENGTFTFKAIAELKGIAVRDGDGQPITSRGQPVTFGLRTVNGVQQVIGIAGDDGDGVLESGERLVFTLSLSELPFGITLPVPAGLLDGIVNDQFTFTLYDQIDHAVPASGATEDIKNIDLSQVLRFTDADGDVTVFDAHTFEIKVIDDTPRQTGATVKGTAEEEHNAGASFPEVNHGNEDTTSGVSPNADKDTAVSGSNAAKTTNVVSGDLRPLVSVGGDEAAQTIAIVFGAPVVTANHGTFFFGSKDSLPVLTSKGQPITYTLTDGNDGDTLLDTLTATSADGRTVFTLTIVNGGTSGGDYTFTLLDQLDHAPGNGENVLNIDFSSVVNFKDFDGDTITLTAGSFSIDVIDDTPVLNTSAAPVTRNVDEDSLSTTSVNPGPDLVNGNLDAVNDGDETSFSQADLRTLIRSGADEDVTFSLVQSISGVVKDVTGADVKSDGKLVRWAVDAGGVFGYADQDASAGFSAGDRIIFRISQPVAGGPINFDLSGEIDHLPGGNDDQTLTLNLSPALRAEDFDHDFISLAPNTVLVAVEDDMPVLVTQPAQLQVLDDEVQTVFAPNVDPVNGGQINTASGTLFVQGADLVRTIAVSSPFDVIGKDVNGFATAETVNWTLVSATGGVWTFVAVGGQGAFYALANPAGMLVIRDNGTYDLTLSAPLRHDAAGEDAKTLTINFTLTDRDNDSVPGSFSVSVQDDTPNGPPLDQAEQPIVIGPVLDDETAPLPAFTGNAGDSAHDGPFGPQSFVFGDVTPNVASAEGAAGTLFKPGADGVSSIAIQSQPFSVLATNFNGLSQAVQVQWSAQPAYGPGGEAIWTATSFDYDLFVNPNQMGDIAATLIIRADGSYKLTLNAPIAHTIGSSDQQSAVTEENALLTFNYTTVDGDGDAASGQLLIAVNDDTPYSKGSVLASTRIDDDAQGLFQGNDAPEDFVPNTKVSQAGAGALFSAGADGVGQFPISAPFPLAGMPQLTVDFAGAGFQVVVKDQFGRASTETATWGSATYLNGVLRYEATSQTYNQFANPNTTATAAAVLEIGLDGSYKLTLFAPVVHAGAGELDDNKRLIFGYTVTDGDGDTGSGLLAVDINDDAPTHAIVPDGTGLLTPVRPPSLDDEAQTVFGFGSGNPGAATSFDRGDVDIDTNTAGGQLFKPGADGIIANDGVGPEGIVISAPNFSVIAKSFNGFAEVVEVHWVKDQTAPLGNVWLAVGDSKYNPFFGQGPAAAVLTVNFDGTYTFELNAPVAHGTNSRDEEDDVTLRINYTVTDADGDTAIGAVDITIDDDTPVTKGLIQLATILDDEGQGGGNDAPADGIDNVKTVSGAAGALFSAGADGVKSIVFDQTPPTTVINVLNTAGSPSLAFWGVDTLNPVNGAVKYILVGGGYSSQNPAAVLIIRTDGSYDFTLNAPLGHGDQTSEDTLTLAFSYTVTDGDGDTTTGRLEIQVNDDTPSPSITMGNVLIADETPGVQNGTGDVAIGSPNFDTPTPLLASLGTIINGATSAAGFVTVAAGADGVSATIFTDAAGAMLVNADSGLTTLDGSKILLTTDTVRPNLLVGMANGVVAIAIQIDPLTGTVSVAEYVPLKHLNAADHNDTLSLAGVAYITVVDADSDSKTTSSPIQITFHDDGPVVGAPEAKTADETGLPSVSAVQGSLAVNFGTDGTAAVPVFFANQTTAIANIHLVNDQGTSVDLATLTSRGDTLQYKLLDASTLVAFTGPVEPSAIDAASVVFSVKLSADSSHPNGIYDFVLRQPLDDLPSAVTDLKFTFDFVAGDGDGDVTPLSTFIVTVHDGVPTIGATEAKTVDEEGLSSSIANSIDGYVGDVAGSNTTATGSLAINWNGDDNNTGAANRSVQFLAALDNTNPDGLFSDGVQVHYTLSTDKTVLTATKGPAGTTVFTVTLDDVTGQYTFAQFDNLDHNKTTGANIEDDIILSFGFTATDSDGDVSQPGTITVTVDDDAPARTGTPDLGAVSEVPLDNPNGAPFPQTTSQSLKIAYGADGMGAKLAFAVDSNGVVHPQGLSSDGVPLSYTVRTFASGEQQLIAFKSTQTADQPVFTVDLSSADSTYNFTLYQNLDHDHSSIVNDTSLSLSFTVIATDGDNDTVAQSFVVTVADDLPAVTIAPNSPLISDETPGAQGSTNDVDLSTTTAPAALPAGAINLAHSAAQYVTFDAGADGLKAVVLGNGDGTRLQNVDSGLKSLDGASILLTTDATNPHLVIGKAGATTVLAIYFDPSDNSIWVAQYKPVFHFGSPNPNDEALLNSVVFVVAIDGDNDPRGALLQVRIRDDGPSLPAFLPQMQAHVVRQLDDEAQTLFAPNFGNGQSTGDVAPDEKSVTGLAGALFTPGTDGTKSVSLLNAPPTFNVIYKDVNGFAASETVSWTGGQNLDGSITFRAQSDHYRTNLPPGLPAAELTINKDGSYAFTLNAPVKADGSAENDLSLAFNYRVTDNDNDTADGILRINVNDDTPTVPPVTIVQGVPQPNVTAQLDDEAQTLFPANPGDAVPGSGDVPDDVKAVTGTLFSAGADGVSSIVINNLANLSFNVIAKSASGLPLSETAAWSQVTADTVGTVKFVAQSNSYNLFNGARIPAAELVIGVDGSYTFTLNAPVAHTAGSGENGRLLDFSYSITDGDNDVAGGVLRININDDAPTVPPLTFVQGLPQPNVTAQLDDEAQTIFPANPGDAFPGSGDVPDDVRTVTGTLFSAGADGTQSILVSAAAPTFAVIFKDSTGLASTEDASWLPAQVNTDGSVVYRAISSHYNASTGTFAAVLTIGADGAYTFTLNAPVAHNQNVFGENNTALNFTYSVTDGDGDTATGALRINVNDDAPTVPQVSPPVQGQQQPNVVGSIDDEAQTLFPANNQPADSFPDVRTATGTLFSAGADGVRSVTISQLPSLSVIYKDTNTNSPAFGAALSEGVSWFQEPTVNGAFTWTALSTHYSTFANPAAKLVINANGSYEFTVFAPVAHPNPDNAETARSLNFDYIVTDGDGDSAAGRLNIQIGDDTLAASGTVLRGDVYESEIANGGNFVIGSASPNSDDKNGDAGNSFGNPDVTNDSRLFGARGSLNSLVAGADGVGSFTTDLTNLATSLRTVRSNGELLTFSQLDSTTVLASNSLGAVFAFHVNQDGSYTFSLFRPLDHRPALIDLFSTSVPLSSIDAPGSVVAGGSYFGSASFQAIGRLPDGDLIVLVGNPTNAAVNWSLDNFSTAGIDYPLTIPAFSSVYVNVGQLSNSTQFLLNVSGGGTIFSQNLFPGSASVLGVVNDTTQTLDQLTLDLSSLVTVIDGDGDRLELKDSLLITVKDDVPVGGDLRTLDEDGSTFVFFGVPAKFGADGPAATNAYVLSESVTTTNAGSDGKLYSNGELVSFKIVNGTLYGYVGNVVPSNQGQPFVVFALQTQNDGSYDFFLRRGLDHRTAADGAVKPITLNFAATATDGDGDVAPVTFAVRVDPAGFESGANALSYQNLTGGVFVNLSEAAVTFGTQAVAANTATDSDLDSSSVDRVGNDNVTGIVNVTGGLGNDVFVGGAEANTFLGNGGNDTFIYAVGGGNDVIDGGADTDRLIVSGDSNKQIVTISATDDDNDPTNGVQDPILVQIDETGDGSVDATVSVSKVEDIELNLGGGNDEVIVNGQSFAGTSLAVSTITVNEGEGNDTLDLRNLTLSNHRVVADGGAGTDTVKFGFAYTSRAMAEMVGTDGVKLTFALANGQTVTHEFKGYESFEFTNGTRTFEQLFNIRPVAADFTPGVAGFQLSAATGHYYQYLAGTQFSSPGSTYGAWAFAQDAAAARGGYLANVTSQAEHDFLNATYNGTVIAPNYSATWIGGSDFGNEGTWTWRYGAEAGQVFFVRGGNPALNGFTAWETNEPNNGGLPVSVPVQNYAAIWNRSIFDPATGTFKPLGTFTWDDTGQTQLNASAQGAMVERDYFTDKSTAALISKASILASVTDADGDALTFTGLVSFTTALGGTLTIVGDDVRYDPTTSATLQAMNGNYQTLQDSFQYTVSDGHGGTTTGTVKFNVGVPQHAAVVASPDVIVETSGPDNGRVYNGQVHVTDADPNSTFKVIGVGKTGDFDGSFPSFFTPVNEGAGTTFFGSHGVFVFNSDGSYTYTAGGGNRNFDFDTIQSTVIDPATGNPVTGNWEPIAIQVQDSSGFITTKNFRVDFQAANEAPVATTFTPGLDGFQYSAATGHYYQYVTQPQANPLAPLTVANAQGYAASKGGYLANITSQAEHDFLNLTYNGTVIAPFGQATWIGGSDFGNEGTWTWRYGSEAGQVFYIRNDPTVYGFTAWEPGEPNNSGGNQNFAAIWNRSIYDFDTGTYLTTGTFTWDDTGQTQLNASAQGAIVERDYFTDKTTAVSFSKASILANVSDFDGDTLTIVSVSNSAKGASVQIAGDNIVYNPNGAPGLTGLTGYATTEDSFTYTVSDGHGNTVTGTVKFNVGVAQHAPVIADPDVIVETSGADNGRVYTGQVHITDADGDTFKVIGIARFSSFNGSLPNTYVAVNEGGAGTTIVGSHGTFVFKSDGSYTYTAGGGVSGVFNFDSIQTTGVDANGNPISGNWEPLAIQVQDSTGQISVRNFRIDFQAANDTPVANADTVTVYEDSYTTMLSTFGAGVIYSNSGTGSDFDPDTNGPYGLQILGVAKGVVSAVAQISSFPTDIVGDYGTLTMFNDGSYVYTADRANALAEGVIGTDVFSYAVKDPAGVVSNVTTLTINVFGLNDTPVITGLVDMSVAENAAGAFLSSFTVTDADTATGLAFRVLDDSDAVDSRFVVVAASGTTFGQPGTYELRLAAGQSLDFETENADGYPAIALKVEVNDQAGSNNITVVPVTVTVTDVSENAAAVISSFTNGTVTENAIAAGANLVSNPGFEASNGNLNSWVKGGASAQIGNSNGTIFGFVHSGNNAAEMSTPGSTPGTLSQDITTTTGQHYTLSYWVANAIVGGSGSTSNYAPGANSFSVSWGGVQVVGSAVTNAPFAPVLPASELDPAYYAFTLYTFDVVGGPGTTTKLLFSETNDWNRSEWGLDDISVSLVPTESTSGTVKFTDPDSADTHDVTFTPRSGGYLGTFAATLGADSTNGGTGTVNWTFSASETALQVLAAGESRIQTYDVKINDHNGNITTQAVNVTLVGRNDAPVMSVGNITNYNIGSAAVAISPAATIVDVDSANFGGGSLKVLLNAFDNTKEFLSIGNQGTGAGQIGVSGSNVSYGGVNIGTFAVAASGTDLLLTVSFNANASNTAVQALLQDITYSATLNQNLAGRRQPIKFTLVDGDGTENSGTDTAVAYANIYLASPSPVTLTTSTDNVVFYSGTNTVNGVIGTGAGTTTYSATATNENLQGGTGIDTLVLAGNGANLTLNPAKITGFEVLTLTGTGNSVTLPSGGNLTFNGGSGNTVTLAGGGSADIINFTGGTNVIKTTAANLTSADYVHGGSGQDTIEFTAASTVLDTAFTLVEGVERLFFSVTGTGANSLTLGANANVAFANGVTVDRAGFAGTFNVAATAFTRDLTVLLGTGSGNLTGGTGNDVFKVNPGSLLAATVNGGTSGFDTVWYTVSSGLSISDAAYSSNYTGIDALKFTSTTAQNVGTLTFGTNANNKFASGLTIDTTGLFAGSTTTINATAFTKSLTFIGGVEADTIGSGSGDDVFQFSNANLNGSDTIDGGAGTDSIKIIDAAIVTDAMFAGKSNIEKLLLGDFTNSVTLGSNAQTMVNGLADKTLTIDASSATAGHGLTVDAASASFATTSHVKVIGGAGDDTLKLLNAHFNSGEYFDGRGGNDTIQITDVANIVDTAFTQISGVEKLLLGAGTHSVTLGAFATTDIGSGTLTVDASASTKLTLDGSAVGAAAHINALGGTSGDNLQGGAGDDRLAGNAGNDTLKGNGGADTFAFAHLGSLNADTIVDFNNGEGDTIDLSALLGAAAEANIGNYVNFAVSGNDLKLSVDTTGNGNFGSGHEVATLQGYAASGQHIVNVVFANHEHQIPV